ACVCVPTFSHCAAAAASLQLSGPSKARLRSPAAATLRHGCLRGCVPFLLARIRRLAWKATCPLVRPGGLAPKSSFQAWGSSLKAYHQRTMLVSLTSPLWPLFSGCFDCAIWDYACIDRRPAAKCGQELISVAITRRVLVREPTQQARTADRWPE